MRIPLIEDLTDRPIPPGTNVMVEYDAASQWYAASLSIAAGWIETGGIVDYSVAAQEPDNIRQQLTRLRLQVEELEKAEKLLIYDWYTQSLGQKSQERNSIESLKVADLSITFLKVDLHDPPIPDELRILDDLSCVERFNDEKAWVDFAISRLMPSTRSIKSTLIFGVIAGVHSERAYRRLEAAVDGIVDLRIVEKRGGTANTIRIRTFRNLHHDSKWHELTISDNFDVALKRK